MSLDQSLGQSLGQRVGAEGSYRVDRVTHFAWTNKRSVKLLPIHMFNRL